MSSNDSAQSFDCSRNFGVYGSSGSPEPSELCELSYGDLKGERMSRLVDVDAAPKKFRLETDVKASVSSELQGLKASSPFLQSAVLAERQHASWLESVYKAEKTRRDEIAEARNSVLDFLDKNKNKDPSAEAKGVASMVDLALGVLRTVLESDRKGSLASIAETAKACLMALPPLSLRGGALKDRLEPVQKFLRSRALDADAPLAERSACVELALAVALGSGSICQALRVVETGLALQAASKDTVSVRPFGIMAKLSAFREEFAPPPPRSRGWKVGSPDVNEKKDAIFEPPVLPAVSEENKKKKAAEAPCGVNAASAFVTKSLSALSRAAADRSSGGASVSRSTGVGVPVKKDLLFELKGDCVKSGGEYVCMGQEPGFAFNPTVPPTMIPPIVKRSEQGFSFFRMHTGSTQCALGWNAPVPSGAYTIFSIDRYFKPEPPAYPSFGRSLQSRDLLWGLGRRYGYLRYDIRNVLVGQIMQKKMEDKLKWVIHCGVWDPSTRRNTWYIDGKLMFMMTAMPDQTPEVRRLAAGRCAKNYENSNFDLASVIAFKRALSPSEVGKVFQYLGNAYGIAVTVATGGEASAGDSQANPLFEPLAIEATDETVNLCLGILEQVRAMYVGEAKGRVSPAQFAQRMAIGRDVLLILKDQLKHLKNKKMTATDIEMSSDRIASSVKLLTTLLTAAPAASVDSGVQKAIREAACDAVVAGFSVIALDTAEKVKWISSLRAASKARRAAGEDTTQIDRAVIHMFRFFTQFDVCLSIFDEMAAKVNEAKSTDATTALPKQVSEFVGSIVQSSAAETVASIAAEAKSEDPSPEQVAMVDLCRRYQATLFSRTRAGLTAVKAAKSELYELPAALLTEFPGDIGTPGQAIEFKFEDRLNPRDFTIDMWLKVDPGNDQTEYTIADCYKQESKQETIIGANPLTINYSGFSVKLRGKNLKIGISYGSQTVRATDNQTVTVSTFPSHVISCYKPGKWCRLTISAGLSEQGLKVYLDGKKVHSSKRGKGLSFISNTSKPLKILGGGSGLNVSSFRYLSEPLSPLQIQAYGLGCSAETLVELERAAAENAKKESMEKSAGSGETTDRSKVELMDSRDGAKLVLAVEKLADSAGDNIKSASGTDSKAAGASTLVLREASPRNGVVVARVSNITYDTTTRILTVRSDGMQDTVELSSLVAEKVIKAISALEVPEGVHVDIGLAGETATAAVPGSTKQVSDDDVDKAADAKAADAKAADAKAADAKAADAKATAPTTVGEDVKEPPKDAKMDEKKADAEKETAKKDSKTAELFERAANSYRKERKEGIRRSEQQLNTCIQLVKALSENVIAESKRILAALAETFKQGDGGSGLSVSRAAKISQRIRQCSVLGSLYPQIPGFAPELGSPSRHALSATLLAGLKKLLPLHLDLMAWAVVALTRTAPPFSGNVETELARKSREKSEFPLLWVACGLSKLSARSLGCLAEHLTLSLPLSEAEKKEERKWLASSLFTGGVAAESKEAGQSSCDLSRADEAKFVDTLVSEADTVKPLMTELERRAGKPVRVFKSIRAKAREATMRLFVVILKHTHLLKAAKEIVDSKDGVEGANPKVMGLLSEYLVQARRISNKMKQIKGMKGSVDKFFNITMGRIRLLMSLNPPPAVPPVDGVYKSDMPPTPTLLRRASSTLQIPKNAPRIRRTRSILKTNSKWRKAKIVLTLLRHAFQAVRRLKRLVQISQSDSASDDFFGSSTARLSAKAAKQAADDILKIVELPENKFKTARVAEALATQRRRAEIRSQGLDAFGEIATVLSTYQARANKALDALLETQAKAAAGDPSFSDAVTAAKRNGALLYIAMPRLSSRGFAERDAKQAVVRDNGHYLTNVGTIGEVLSAQMAEKYFSIVKGLTVQPALDDRSKLCVLQLCNIDLRDRDIVHVDRIGLLPFVTPLVTFPVPRGFGSDDDAVRAAGFFNKLSAAAKQQTEKEMVRYAGWALFRLIAYISTEYPAMRDSVLGSVLQEAQTLLEVIDFQCDAKRLDAIGRGVERRARLVEREALVSHQRDARRKKKSAELKKRSVALLEANAFDGKKASAALKKLKVTYKLKSGFVALTNPLESGSSMLNAYTLSFDVKIPSLPKDKAGLGLLKSMHVKPLLYVKSDGVVGFEPQPGADGDAKENAGKLVAGKWSRVVLTVNCKSQTGEVYVDGELSCGKNGHHFVNNGKYAFPSSNMNAMALLPFGPAEARVADIMLRPRAVASNEVKDMIPTSAWRAAKGDSLYMASIEAIWALMTDSKQDVGSIPSDKLVKFETGSDSVVMSDLVEAYTNAHRLDGSLPKAMYEEDVTYFFLWCAAYETALVAALPKLDAVRKCMEERKSRAVEFKVVRSAADPGQPPESPLELTLSVDVDTTIRDIGARVRKNHWTTGGRDFYLDGKALERDETLAKAGIKNGAVLKLQTSDWVGSQQWLIWTYVDRYSHIQDASMDWFRYSAAKSLWKNFAHARPALPSPSEVGLYLSQLLWMLLRILKSKGVAEKLRAPGWINILLDITVKRQLAVAPAPHYPLLHTAGILATKALQSLLCHVNPGEVLLTFSGEEILNRIFKGVAGFVLPSASEAKATSNVYSSLAFEALPSRYNITGFGVCWELVMLFRRLMRGGTTQVQDEWREISTNRLIQSAEYLADPKVLAALEPVADESSSGDDEKKPPATDRKADEDVTSKMQDLFAALVILGGETEPIREGGRVSVSGESEMGTVVEVVSKTEDVFKTEMTRLESKDDGNSGDAADKGGDSGRIVRVSVLLDSDTVLQLSGSDIARVRTSSASDFPFQAISNPDTIVKLLGTFVANSPESPLGYRLQRMCLNALRSFLNRPAICRSFAQQGFAEPLAKLSLSLSPLVAKMPLSVENLEDRLFAINAFDRGEAIEIDTKRGGTVSSGPSTNDFYAAEPLTLRVCGQRTNVASTPTIGKMLKPFAKANNVRWVVSRQIFTAVLTVDGEVWTFGGNSYQCLGRGRTVEEGGALPRPVPFPGGIGIKQIAAGNYHCVCIAENGQLFSWGDNYYGQLGTGNNSELGTPTKPSFYTGKRVLTVGCGNDHTLAVVEGVGVVAHGMNSQYQCGNAPTGNQNLLNPFKIPGLDASKVVQVTGTNNGSAAVTSDGKLYVWGGNMGARGAPPGTPNTQRTPLEIKLPKGERCVQVSMSAYAVVALAHTGTVYSAGSNKCFLGHNEVRRNHWAVPDLGGAKGVYVSSGGSHTMVIDEKGGIWTWGGRGNWLGNTAHPMMQNQYNPKPFKMSIPGGIKPFTVVSCKNLSFVLSGTQPRLRPPGPFSFGGGGAVMGGGSGSAVQEQPLPPYPLAAYLWSKRKASKRVNDDLVQFSIYTHDNRDMVDANSKSPSSTFGSNTGQKFLAFVNPQPETVRYNIVTKPCPGVKGDKHFYSLCRGAPASGEGWQMSPASYNHFFAYPTKHEGAAQFGVYVDKKDASRVRVRLTASTDEKDRATTDMLFEFWAYMEASQYNARTVMDVVGSSDARIRQVSAFGKDGSLEMPKANALTLDVACLRDATRIVDPKDETKALGLALTLTVALNAQGKQIEAKTLLSLPGIKVSIKDQEICVAAFGDEAKTFPLKESKDAEDSKGGGDDQEGKTSAGAWSVWTCVIRSDERDIAGEEDGADDAKGTADSKDGKSDEKKVKLAPKKRSNVAIYWGLELVASVSSNAALSLDSGDVVFVDGFAGQVRGAAVWDFDLDESQLSSFLTHGAAYTFRDCLWSKKEVESLATIDLATPLDWAAAASEGKTTKTFSAKLLPGCTVVGPAAPVSKAAANFGDAGSKRKLKQSALALAPGSHLMVKQALGSSDKPTSQMTPITDYALILDVFLPVCAEPYSLFDATGGGEPRPENCTSYAGLSSTFGGFPASGVRWGQTRAPVPGTPSTMECWVLLPRNCNGRIGTIAGNKWLSWYAQSNGNVAIKWGHDKGFTNKTFVTTDIRTGLWLHLAVVLDMMNKNVTVYINGESAEKPKSFTNLPVNFSEEVAFIGNCANDAETAFSGKIRDLRMWSTVRTQAEIKAAMGSSFQGPSESKLPITGKENGLIAWYKLDETGPYNTGVVSSLGGASGGGDDDAEEEEDDAALAQLMAMGFSKRRCAYILDDCDGNVQEAVEALMEGVEETPEFIAEYEAKQTAKAAKKAAKAEEKAKSAADQGAPDSAASGSGKTNEAKSLEQKSKMDLQDSLAGAKGGAFVIECAEDGEDGLIAVMPDGKVKILGVSASSRGEDTLPLGEWTRLAIIAGPKKIKVCTEKTQFTSKDLNPMQRYFAGLRPQFTVLGEAAVGRDGAEFAIRGIQVTKVKIAEEMYKLVADVKDAKAADAKAAASKAKEYKAPLTLDVFQGLRKTVLESKTITQTLVGMKFPQHWAMKALERNAYDFKRASDYLRTHKRELKIEDRTEDMNIAANTLAKMGLPIDTCESAMRKAALSVDADTSVGVITQHAIGLVFSGLGASESKDAGAKARAAATDESPEAIEEKKRVRTETVKSQLASILEETKELKSTVLDARLYSDAVASPKPRRQLAFLGLPKFSPLDTQDAIKKSLEAFEEKRKALVATREVTDRALAVAYSRLGVLLLLKNLTATEIESLGLLTNKDMFFLARLLRVVEFTHLPGALDQLRGLLNAKITEESGRLQEWLDKNDTRGGGGGGDAKTKPLNVNAVPRSVFSRLAPIVDQMVQELVNQLIVILRLPTYDASKDEKAEENILEGRKRNVGVCLWIVQLFIDLFDQAAGLGKNQEVLLIRPFVFSSEVVNLLLETVVLCKGNARLSFLRLLGSLVNSNTDEKMRGLPKIQFNLERTEILLELMDQVKSAESKEPSEFLRSLVALNQALVRMAEEQERELEPDEEKRAAKKKKARQASIGKKIDSAFIIVTRKDGKDGDQPKFEIEDEGTEAKAKAAVAKADKEKESSKISIREGKIVHKSEGLAASVEAELLNEFKQWRNDQILERNLDSAIQGRFSDTFKHPNIVLSEGGTLAKHFSNRSVCVDYEIKSGKVTWTFEMRPGGPNNQCYAMAGIIPSTSKPMCATHTGHTGDTTFNGFAVYTINNNWSAYYKGKNNQCGYNSPTPNSSPRKLQYTVDCAAKTMTVLEVTNDNAKVYEFKDIPVPCYPCVTLFQGDVHIGKIQSGGGGGGGSDKWGPESKYPKWFEDMLLAERCMRSLADPAKSIPMPDTFVRAVWKKMFSSDTAGSESLGLNLALGRKAVMSSVAAPGPSLGDNYKTLGYYQPVLATDGHRDQTCVFTAAMSREESNPYLDIDLGEAHSVSKVVAWLPTDASRREKMFPLQITCSDKPFAEDASPADARSQALLCGQYKKLDAKDGLVKVNLSSLTIAEDAVDFYSPVGVFSGKGFVLDLTSFASKFNVGDYVAMHKASEKPSAAQPHQYVAQKDTLSYMWWEATNTRGAGKKLRLSYVNKDHKVVAQSQIFEMDTLDTSAVKVVGPAGSKTATSGMFNDGSTKPVTKIMVMYTTEKIMGLQLWYGGVAAKLHGQDSSNASKKTINIAEGDYINSVEFAGTPSYVVNFRFGTAKGFKSELFGKQKKPGMDHKNWKEVKTDNLPEGYRLVNARGAMSGNTCYRLEFEFASSEYGRPQNVPLLSRLSKYDVGDESLRLRSPVFPGDKNTVVTGVKGQWPGKRLTPPLPLEIPKKRPEKDAVSFCPYLTPALVYVLIPDGVEAPEWMNSLGFRRSDCVVSVGTPGVKKQQGDAKTGSDAKTEANTDGSVDMLVYCAGPFPPGQRVEIPGPTIKAAVSAADDEKKGAAEEKKGAKKDDKKDEAKGSEWKDCQIVLVARADTTDTAPSSLRLSTTAVDCKAAAPVPLKSGCLTVEAIVYVDNPAAPFDLVNEKRDGDEGNSPLRVYVEKVDDQCVVKAEWGANKNINLGALGLRAKKWDHVAVVWSKKRLTLFRNGQRVKDVKRTAMFSDGAAAPALAAWAIGGRSSAAVDAKDGDTKDGARAKSDAGALVSELRVWACARTEAQIRTFSRVRLSSLPNGGDVSDLVACFELTQGSVSSGAAARGAAKAIAVLSTTSSSAESSFASQSPFMVERLAKPGSLVLSSSDTNVKVRYVRVQAERKDGQLIVPQIEVFKTRYVGDAAEVKRQIVNPTPSFKILNGRLTHAAITAIVTLINRWSNSESKDPSSLESLDDIKLDMQELQSSQHIQRLSLQESHVRLAVATLCEFNKKFNDLIGFVDLSLPRSYSSLTDGVRDARNYIFWYSKKAQFEQALKATTQASKHCNVNFDFIGAREVFSKRKTDHKARRTLFGQCFQQLKNKDASMFKVGTNVRAFRANYLGMGSIDAGGPYRDALENICKELQSPGLPLFMRCPNRRHNVGENKNTFVPRPSSTSAFHIELYKFVGKLFGLAMRSKSLLSLDLPSIVWKPLVSDVVTESDVVAIDKVSWNVMDEVRKQEDKVESKRMDQAIFDSTMRQFKLVAAGSDGKIKELVPNGKSISLQWSNRKLYARKVQQFRLHEFDEQMQAVRSGLAEVVPITILSMFTWRELEAQVAGYGMTDKQIDLLYKMTDYSGCSKTDPHIKFFWKILRERFNNEQRVKFLIFVWGRSRLPVTEDDFEKKFTINMHHSSGSADMYFPIAHTCFFSVDMPAYSSLDVMYQKLLWAMNNCTSIDADGGPIGTRPIGPQDSDDELETLFD